MDNKINAPLAGGTARTFDEVARAQGWDESTQLFVLRQYVEHQQDDAALDDFAEQSAAYENAGGIELPTAADLAGVKAPAERVLAETHTIPVSAAFRAEYPWCGWLFAFHGESDADTVSSFGIHERLLGLNVLLTTADGRSRPVNILDNAATVEEPDYPHGAIEVTELDTKDYEPMKPERRETVRYEDIREIVVF